MLDAIKPARPPDLAADNALLLDVDGTLLDFADTPQQVCVPAQLLHDLAVLQQRLDGALALVSGRPLEQIDRLFSPLCLPAAGQHGHQLRHAGRRLTQPAPPRAWLQGVRLRAAELARSLPGLLVEDKGIGLALHWRRNPDIGGIVTDFAHAQLQQAQRDDAQLALALGRVGEAAANPGYRLQAGDHVIEFVPAASDKGFALRQLMQQPPFAGRRPLYLGDDLTDEYAFAAANRLGGDSILVGTRHPSAAHWQLDNPAAVRAWLHHAASDLSAAPRETH